MTTTPTTTTSSPDAAMPTTYRYQTMEWAKSDFGDGWDTLSDADVLALLTPIYPELNNARTKVETTGTGAETRRIVTFERQIGTKGGARPASAGMGTDQEMPPDGGAIIDPQPRLLWDAIAALPTLQLRCYELAHDMQHLSLDDMLDKGDTLEGAIEEAEREIQAVSELTDLLLPHAQHAPR